MSASDRGAGPVPDGERALLRHALATLVYRAEKTLAAPPAEFAELRIAPDARTPLQLVGHLGDVLEWAFELCEGRWTWKAASLGAWDADVQRFRAAAERLDARLADAAPLGHPATQIFQGPIADAFTHVGQLALLRRLAGAPVRPESFARAEIRAGNLAHDPDAPRREFDGDASFGRR